VSSVLWAVHPARAETVCHLTALPSSWALCFVLVGFYFWIDLAKEQAEGREGKLDKGMEASVIAMVCFGIAAYTKPMHASTLFVALLLMHCTGDVRVVKAKRKVPLPSFIWFLLLLHVFCLA